MRSLITGIAKGSGSTRVLGGTVQTFTPVSKGADGAVAIVEVDQPFAVVEAQTSDLWSTLRLVIGRRTGGLSVAPRPHVRLIEVPRARARGRCNRHRR